MAKRKRREDLMRKSLEDEVLQYLSERQALHRNRPERHENPALEKFEELARPQVTLVMTYFIDLSERVWEVTGKPDYVLLEEVFEALKDEMPEYDFTEGTVRTTRGNENRLRGYLPEGVRNRLEDYF